MRIKSIKKSYQGVNSWTFICPGCGNERTWGNSPLFKHVFGVCLTCSKRVETKDFWSNSQLKIKV